MFQAVDTRTLGLATTDCLASMAEEENVRILA